MRLLIALAVLTAPAFGCECAPITVCSVVNSPTVFIGQVIAGGVESIREDPWYSNATSVRFKVLENLKGLPAGTQTVDVKLFLLPGMCAPIPYYPGRTYLVTPHVNNGAFEDGICFTGIDVRSAAETVRDVREYFAKKPGWLIHGRVAPGESGAGLIDYLIEGGLLLPSPGATVFTTQRGITYTAETDANGWYNLYLPGKGSYRIPGRKAALSRRSHNRFDQHGG